VGGSVCFSAIGIGSNYCECGIIHFSSRLTFLSKENTIFTVKKGKIMSIVAEYAALLHKKTPKNNVKCEMWSVKFPELQNIEAIIVDIYGTLINYSPLKLDENQKKVYQLEIFYKTAFEFGFLETLKKIDPQTAPEKTLANFYSGLLIMLSEQAGKDGKKFFEPKVDDVWNLILSILLRNGYEIDKYQIGNRNEFAKCIAYFFHFFSFGRSSLFENCGKTLLELKNKGINLGLLANTQFYTTIELSLLLREDGICDDYLDLFDDDFCFFSFDFEMSKQSGVMTRKLFDTLYDYNILPENSLFVSANSQELQKMDEIGLKTALANVILE
jgi:FMN phosphatase YigB (HAD superfamily)